ncbi:MAG: histidine kinase [Bacteroidota bacterium]
MLKRGRIYIYASLSLVFVTYNFIFEMVFSTVDEAVIESLVLFPMVFLFLFFIYWMRLKVLNSSFTKKFIAEKPSNRMLLIVGLILASTIVITVSSKLVSLLFLEKEEENQEFLGWLFVTIFISVLVVTIFIYFLEEYVSSINDKHKMAEEISNYELEKTHAKYNALKKQLNPHFLFNSFNSLLTLIHFDSPKAEKFVEELSSIYRYNLSKSDELVVRLSEELQMIDSYIHLQKIRFGDALQYKTTINFEADKLLLPPMTLQLLVENAIKHNKINRDHPLQIQVHVEEDEVYVSNNLQLKERYDTKVDSFGIGISNIESQIKLISNKTIQITQNEHAYKVVVPLLKTELDD